MRYRPLLRFRPGRTSKIPSPRPRGRHCHDVGYRRSPGNFSSPRHSLNRRVTDVVWSAIAVSVQAHAPESVDRRCAQLRGFRSGPPLGPRLVHGALAFWMQTSGTTLLAVERCSLVRVWMAAQDSRSAHGLLYFAAVWDDRHYLIRRVCRRSSRPGSIPRDLVG